MMGAVIVALLLAAPSARSADPPDAGAAATPAASATPAAPPGPACEERLPNGATRPTISETFPNHGTSGYVASLVITVGHGKGETVMPNQLEIRAASDAGKAMKTAGFAIPDPEAGTAPKVDTESVGPTMSTKVQIPFVLLPKEGGRSLLTLPPLPISIARANGELIVVCTRPHRIVVDDPIANDPDPKVKPNPPPRPQREDWAFARLLALGLALGTLAGICLALAYRSWSQRPKVVYVPPPRPAWIVALEELELVRRSTLLSEGRTPEYFDRVSDAVRKYLGAHYGFDGLESTTDEMRAHLRKQKPTVPELNTIAEFLADCDLVKFARVVPAESDCLVSLERGEQIVRATRPAEILAQPAAPRPAPRPEARS